MDASVNPLGGKSVAKRSARNLGARMRLSESTKAAAIEAAGYGMPIDRIALLCGFPGNQTQWHRWIAANPEFQAHWTMLEPWVNSSTNAG